MVKSVGKYDLYKTLGMGAFGKVKFGVNRETQEPVAIKILDKAKIQVHNMTNQIKREISIMKMVNHKHVIQVKDVFATATKIFIVLELVEGGELFDKVVSVGKFTEEQARFYFRQIIEGLEHCHSIGVCHRDLKPENLLLDKNGNIKISDFGLATLYVGDSSLEGSAQRNELLHTTCGTPNYVAPEVLANHGYDGFMADVWSIGVILYVLIAGYLPFEEKTMAALFAKIKAADFTYPTSFPPLLRSLLNQILVADPKQRLTLKQVKQHPWVSQGTVETPTGDRYTLTGHEWDTTNTTTNITTNLAPGTLEAGGPVPQVSQMGDGTTEAVGDDDVDMDIPDTSTTTCGVSGIGNNVNNYNMINNNINNNVIDIKGIRLEDNNSNNNNNNNSNNNNNPNATPNSKPSLSNPNSIPPNPNNPNSTPVHSAPGTPMSPATSERPPRPRFGFNLFPPSSGGKTTQGGQRSLFSCICNPFAAFQGVPEPSDNEDGGDSPRPSRD